MIGSPKGGCLITGSLETMVGGLFPFPGEGSGCWVCLITGSIDTMVGGK